MEKDCKHGEINENKAMGKISFIKSQYIFKKIFSNLPKKIYLKIIKENKKMQNRLTIGIHDYKRYSEIEIEIIPSKHKYSEFIKSNKLSKFLNIPRKEDESYYHIYFNESKKEIKKYELSDDNDIEKIKVIIDHKIRSFKGLFQYCQCIESISFNNFQRDNIIDMSYMFYECSSLKKIDLSNFKTDKVTSMNCMFFGCSSLEEIIFPSINTSNLSNMSYMFFGCSSLKELNLSRFNTKNVLDMNSIFFKCSSLKKLNLSSFTNTNLNYMKRMFYGCYSLLELDLSQFNKDEISNKEMFLGCPDQLEIITKDKIIRLN